MESIGYGVIIGFLIGVGMFAGFWLCLQVKSSPGWQPFSFLHDKGEEEEIMKAGRVKPANYDEPPKTAEEWQAKYQRDGYHEDLVHEKRK